MGLWERKSLHEFHHNLREQCPHDMEDTGGRGDAVGTRRKSERGEVSLDHIRVGAYHIVGPVFLFRDILLENYALRMIYARW